MMRKGPTLKATAKRPHLPRPYGRPTGWLRLAFAGLSRANKGSLVGSRDTAPLG